MITSSRSQLFHRLFSFITHHNFNLKLAIVLTGLIGVYCIYSVSRADQLSQAIYFTQIGEYETALEIYNRLPGGHNADMIYYRASLYNEMGDYNLAIQDYTQALSIDPDNWKIYRDRGKVYEKMEEYELAIRDYNQLLLAVPNSVYPNVYIAQNYLNLNQADLAIEHLNIVIDKQPEPHLYILRANAYIQNQDFERAVSDLGIAIDADSDDDRLYFRRAQAYARMNNISSALQDINTAIALVEDPRYYDFRGHLYASEANYDQALEDISYAIILAPDRGEIYLNRGEVYLNLEQYNEAITDFSTAIDLGEDNSSTYFHRATAYYQLDNLDIALTDLNHAIDLGEHLDAYKLRSSIYVAHGDYSLALADYNTIFDLDSDSATELISELRKLKRLVKDDNVDDTLLEKIETLRNRIELSKG